jgi:Acetyltransferase (GNAT) domain
VGVNEPHAAARELEWVSSEYMLRWLGQMPDVTITAFGAARAARTPGWPDVDFLNTVHRLLPEEADQVPRIAAHYAEAGVQPWLELMPAPGFDRLAAALTAAGGHQIGFLAMSERDLPAPPAADPPAGVTVESVDPADVEDFARVLATGHDIPGDHLEGAIGRMRHHAGVAGARLYLARVDGVPAAAAVLLAEPPVAYLANASTPEAQRRRGCQTALIRRRLADAAAAGCTRAAVIAEWASQSHANVTRAGFRGAYTKAIWRLGVS